jgi:hypothetical protein
LFPETEGIANPEKARWRELSIQATGLFHIPLKIKYLKYKIARFSGMDFGQLDALEVAKHRGMW